MPVVKMVSISGKHKYLKEVNMTSTGRGTIELDFPYDEYLKDEIKIFDGARWNPDKKCWTVKDNPRNWFQFRFLMGDNPYKWYDRPLIEFESRVPNVYPQQYLMAQEFLTYRQVIWAAEMGLGKTLAAILAIEYAAEHFEATRCWWVGPRSASASFEVEVATWGMAHLPERIMTYEEMVKTIKNWPPGLQAPHIVIFDEASRLKTLTTQRTQAAIELVTGMREDHGENEAFICLMTGTPAPKSPLDWFSLCEVAKPGFIREGNIHKFRDRLGVVEKREGAAGGVYPHTVTWRDSEDKCKYCGSTQLEHDFDLMAKSSEPHEWTKGTNEVAKLYKRMKGLVSVYFKKDWLSFLPDKQYRVFKCKVSRSTVNAASAVQSNAKRAIQALTMLRELSDGFLYQDVQEGTTKCQLCSGTKRAVIPVLLDEEGTMEFQEVECTNCGGEGVVPKSVRIVNSVTCPKDDILESILDDHEDGRLVIYAGFTGSIDRIVQICLRKGWQTIRVDGRGWEATLPVSGTTEESLPKKLLNIFQRKVENSMAEKLAYVAHPASGGMGVTLTASTEIVYYSNDFNAESRIQSEDRCHRPGMDLNKGCMITDIVHLPSDMLIIDNLKNKRRLQDMSLGQFHESMKMAEENRLL